MKKLLFLFVFAAHLLPAQEIEDLQEGYFFSENSKNFFRVDIKKPYDFYKVNSCAADSKFVRAQFPGGDAAFNRELFKYISAYVDRETYVVNGNFYIQIEIDADGKAQQIEIHPKVANSELFLRDLKFAIRKIKKSWIPATCDASEIPSKIRITMNFVSEGADF